MTALHASKLLSPTKATGQFMAAVTNGQAHLLPALLRAGADPWRKSIFGSTALHMAARAGHPAIIQALLGLPGCDRHVLTPSGATALVAAVHGGCLECMHLLGLGERDLGPLSAERFISLAARGLAPSPKTFAALAVAARRLANDADHACELLRLALAASDAQSAREALVPCLHQFEAEALRQTCAPTPREPLSRGRL